ncbi:hypothetical protein ABT202_29295 [Streptomyces sp900105245]|uniref:hypothetical protein n=1 Tax=Streptomyces sp. 900105245 TaxID=3154379 RepID=UPI0033228281
MLRKQQTAARLGEAQTPWAPAPAEAPSIRPRPCWPPTSPGDRTPAAGPSFAPQAVGLGVRAVFSLPLSIGRPAIGTLDFYRDTAGALADRDLRTALWVRDAVTFTPLNRHTADDFPRMGEGR